MYLCDFHIHSQNSDGKLSIPEIIDLYGKQGFGAIAITDHLCESNTFLGKSARLLNKTIRQNSFLKYLFEIHKEAQRALRQYNMLVIPGVEFTKNSFVHTDSAHLVGLGIQSFIDPDLSVDEIISAVHQQRGIIIAAHPVSTRKIEPQTYHLWYNRERLSKSIDAWEVASGSHLFREVYESGLPMVANSDLHVPRQISSWKTVLSGPRTMENIFLSIQKQNLQFMYYQAPSVFEGSIGLDDVPLWADFELASSPS